MNDIKPKKHIKELKQFLSNHGGKRFQYNFFLNNSITKDDVEYWFNCGDFFNGKYAILNLMTCNQCYLNSVRYCQNNSDYLPYYGMALSDDGIWRMHGWAVNKYTNGV